ncbi:hypothetical protein DFH28DRAFT_465054 [Melampsora americana]|nr:hypothetical protein DFH28DRAFT_465054 [Melampsora americana]
MELQVIFINMIILALKINLASGHPLQPVQHAHLSSIHGMDIPTFTESNSVVYPIIDQKYFERSKDMQRLHKQAHKDFGIEPQDIGKKNSEESLEKNVFCYSKEGKSWLYSHICDQIVLFQEQLVLEAFRFLGLRYFAQN